MKVIHTVNHIRNQTPISLARSPQTCVRHTRAEATGYACQARLRGLGDHPAQPTNKVGLAAARPQ